MDVANSANHVKVKCRSCGNSSGSSSTTKHSTQHSDPTLKQTHAQTHALAHAPVQTRSQTLMQPQPHLETRVVSMPITLHMPTSINAKTYLDAGVNANTSTNAGTVRNVGGIVSGSDQIVCFKRTHRPGARTAAPSRATSPVPGLVAGGQSALAASLAAGRHGRACADSAGHAVAVGIAGPTRAFVLQQLGELAAATAAEEEAVVAAASTGAAAKHGGKPAAAEMSGVNVSNGLVWQPHQQPQQQHDVVIIGRTNSSDREHSSLHRHSHDTVSDHGHHGAHSHRLGHARDHARPHRVHRAADGSLTIDREPTPPSGRDQWLAFLTRLCFTAPAPPADRSKGELGGTLTLHRLGVGSSVIIGNLNKLHTDPQRNVGAHIRTGPRAHVDDRQDKPMSELANKADAAADDAHSDSKSSRSERGRRRDRGGQSGPVGKSGSDAHGSAHVRCSSSAGVKTSTPKSDIGDATVSTTATSATPPVVAAVRASAAAAAATAATIAAKATEAAAESAGVPGVVLVLARARSAPNMRAK